MAFFLGQRRFVFLSILIATTSGCGKEPVQPDPKKTFEVYAPAFYEEYTKLVAASSTAEQKQWVDREYTIDVQKTESLVSPNVATIDCRRRIEISSSTGSTNNLNLFINQKIIFAWQENQWVLTSAPYEGIKKLKFGKYESTEPMSGEDIQGVEVNAAAKKALQAVREKMKGE